MTEGEITIAIMAFMLLLAILVLILCLIARTNRMNRKFDDIEVDIHDINRRLGLLSLDQMRSNLMLLISDYPDNPKIEELAQCYVVTFQGNSYLIPIIMKWYRD